MLIKLDFAKIRKDRQYYNNTLVAIAIKANDLKTFYRIINRNALNRILLETHITLD